MNLCVHPEAIRSHDFSPAFEYIDESFFFFSTEFRIGFLNTGAKELSKKIYGRLPILGDSILDYVSDGRRENFRAVLMQVVKGDMAEYEIQVEATDTWLHCKYFPATNEHGTVTGIYALLKDISSQKALSRLKEQTGIIEKDLFESRLLFEQFMQNSPLVSWLTDGAGVMHYMNPICLRNYGLTENDLGASMFELFEGQSAVDWHITNQQVIKTGQPGESIEKVVNANGEEQVMKIYKFPLLVSNEIMVGAWAADITDQAELQALLIKSIERHEYVNEATSDAIYDWTISTGRIYRGSGYETLFGYKDKEASLKTRLSLIHPEDYEHYKQNVFKALRNQQADRWKIEYRFRDFGGNYRTVIDKAFIIRSQNKAVRVIGAMQDITSQKELQQQLINQEKKNKQKLVKSIIETQEKERRKLSVELHDNVNQMLASCKLMLEVAIENEGSAKMLTEKSYQCIQTVINEIRRISHELNPSAIVDVGLREAIEQLIEKINISGKVNILFLPNQLPYKNYLNEDDKIAIFRIVQEQLNNILKHSRANNVLIKLDVGDDTVTLCIKDDGIGYDKAKCKMGLGLRNIHNRIEYYGGTINIHTAEGKGVEMCIALKSSFKPCLRQHHLRIA